MKEVNTNIVGEVGHQVYAPSYIEIGPRTYVQIMWGIGEENELRRDAAGTVKATI